MGGSRWEKVRTDFDALPLLAVERRAEDPISRLRTFVDDFGSDQLQNRAAVAC